MEPSGTAVVTGASRGIGRAVAIELARRGFDVVAGMRDPSMGADLASEAGDASARIRVERLDVTDLDAFVAPDDLRVLVNNAGLRQQYLPVEQTPLAEWRTIFETNVFAVFELCRRCIPVMRKAGTGVICNIGSSSILNPQPFFGTYAGSKSAMSNVTAVLRVELAPFGIRVIEVMPGPIETDLLATSVTARIADAAEFEPYRPMAQLQHERAQMARAASVPTSYAADAIADAILSDGGPLRYGCDPLSVQSIESWRHADPEATIAGIVGSFAAG